MRQYASSDERSCTHGKKVGLAACSNPHSGLGTQATRLCKARLGVYYKDFPLHARACTTSHCGKYCHSVIIKNGDGNVIIKKEERAGKIMTHEK